jgi:hypothetical protein
MWYKCYTKRAAAGKRGFIPSSRGPQGHGDPEFVDSADIPDYFATSFPPMHAMTMY